MIKQIEWEAQDGDDKGKIFVITKMPAYQTEMFAFKLISAMGQSGINIGQYANQGTAYLVEAGVEALAMIRFDLARPLLDEMMECVKIKMSKITRPLVDDDIEEVMTRFRLRAEILKLHTSFFTADDQSISGSESQAENNSLTTRIPRKQ